MLRAFRAARAHRRVRRRVRRLRCRRRRSAPPVRAVRRDRRRDIRACRGIAGRNRCVVRTPRASRSSPRATRGRSASRSICNGLRTASWPRPPRARATPDWRSACTGTSPIGAAPDGSEPWANPGGFALACPIGAPPDPFSPTGQVWDLPPPDPNVMIATACAGFRELARREHAPRGGAADRSRDGAVAALLGARRRHRRRRRVRPLPVRRAAGDARRSPARARAASSSAKTWARCRTDCASGSPTRRFFPIACCGSSATATRSSRRRSGRRRRRPAYPRTTCRPSRAGGPAPTSTSARRWDSLSKADAASARAERQAAKAALAAALQRAGRPPGRDGAVRRRGRRPRCIASSAARRPRWRSLQADDLSGEDGRAQPPRDRPRARELAPQARGRRRCAMADRGLGVEATADFARARRARP